MAFFVDDLYGIQGVGVIRDPRNGNTSLESTGPSGMISVEDQNDYYYDLWNPNDGTVLHRSGDALSGTMHIQSVCAELIFDDGFFHNYTLTQPTQRSLVSFYQKYSIVGNFNEIAHSTKSGIVAAGSFSGNPKKYTVVFGTNFSDTNYSILIDGIDARSWTYEVKTVSGFIIDANANQTLTSEVSWHATRISDY
jgi:hypothetical protein